MCSAIFQLRMRTVGEPLHSFLQQIFIKYCLSWFPRKQTSGRDVCKGELAGEYSWGQSL